MAVNESAYRFGEFRLIPAQRELWCSDQLVSVQPKVLDTLVYLVQHRDRAVSGDELAAAVWGRDEVTDNVLGQIVGRARRTVGDSGEAQHSIRTVLRFGYRWIRDIEVLPFEEASPPIKSADTSAVGRIAPSAPPSPSQRANFVRWWSALATTIAALGIVTLAGWRLNQHLPADSPLTRATVLAVDPSAWPVAERIERLHDALASDQLDLARSIFRTFSDQDRAQPMVRHDAAELALKEGRFDEALRAFNTLLADLGERGPAMVVGSSLFGAGIAEYRLSHLSAAQKYFERAIPILSNAGPKAQVKSGLAWSGLGSIFTARETYDAADRAYAKARSALQDAGDLGALAKLECNVGISLIGRYRYADALERFQRATELAAQTNDVNAEAYSRMNLVNAQLVLLHPAAALESEVRLRELRDRIGDPVLAAHADVVRAKALIANGRLKDAALALRAGEARPTATNGTLLAMRHFVSAELAFAQGSLGAGINDVRSVLALPWDTFGDDGVAAYARWRLFEASQTQDNVQGIADAVAATDALNKVRPNEPTVSLYAALTHAEVADARGDAAEARSEFERALAQVKSTRVPFDLVRVVASYTRFLLRHGEVDEARVVAGQVSGWVDEDYSAALVQLDVAHAIGGAAWTAALAQTRRLAGERVIPATLIPPSAPVGHHREGTELASIHPP